MRRITVVPYDPLWVQEFARASGQVTSALGVNLLEIEHIGSTAIPGMHAKALIDMLAIVSDIAAVDQQLAQMQSLGYESLGEFGIARRRYFRRDNALGERTHQIHAFQIGSPHIQRHLAFRDFMRAHSTVANQYAELKRKLAIAHPDDVTAYMDGKDSFIKEMEVRALAWVATRGDMTTTYPAAAQA